MLTPTQFGLRSCIPSATPPQPHPPSTNHIHGSAHAASLHVDQNCSRSTLLRGICTNINHLSENVMIITSSPRLGLACGLSALAHHQPSPQPELALAIPRFLLTAASWLLSSSQPILLLPPTPHHYSFDPHLDKYSRLTLNKIPVSSLLKALLAEYYQAQRRVSL